MPIDPYVGAHLRHLREAAGLNLSAVSIKVAIPEAILADYERGDRRPSSAELVTLARFFGVTLAELFPVSPGQLH